MNTSDYNNMIDPYLLGQLDEAKQKLFEEQLQTNPDLANAVKEQKQAIELLGAVHDMEMKLEVQEVQKVFLSAPNSKIVFRWLKPMLAAAALLLLIATCYWLFKNPTSEQLFNNYYAVYNTGFGDRDATTPSKIELAKATQLYKQKDFDKALPLLKSAMEKEKNSKVQMMLGISYMEVQDYENAIDLFEDLALTKDPSFQYHGIWFAALSQLKSNRIEQCKALLLQLTNAKNIDEVYKQKEAKELLNRIEQYKLGLLNFISILENVIVRQQIIKFNPSTFKSEKNHSGCPNQFLTVPLNCKNPV